MSQITTAQQFREATTLRWRKNMRQKHSYIKGLLHGSIAGLIIGAGAAGYVAHKIVYHVAENIERRAYQKVDATKKEVIRYVDSKLEQKLNEAIQLYVMRGENNSEMKKYLEREKSR